jgi:integrase
VEAQVASDAKKAPHRGHNEGTISVRENLAGEVTSYQARVTVAGGRRSQSFKSKAEAKRWLTTARADAVQGRLNPRRPPTLAEYLRDTWLPSVEDKVKTSTHVSYKLNVARVPAWLGSARLDELKPSHFQRFYTELSKCGKAPRTVRQVHMTLHKALEDALRLDLVSRNPTHGAALPRVPDTEKYWYSDEQLARLFQATEADRFHALWVVLGTLGLRLSEGLGLQWTDIDWQRKTIAIRRTLQRDRGGGGLGLSELKTRGSRRTLTLTTRALEALKAHQDRQEWAKRKAGFWQPTGLIFTTAYGTGVEQGRIHQHWTPACAKAGIPRYRPQDLRHSVASSLIAGGMGLLEVAHMLGHADASMVVKVYGHIAPGDHRTAADMMDANLARHARIF